MSAERIHRYPLLHAQSVIAEDAVNENEFARQSPHATALIWYLPASHAVHGPPSGPVYPALHLQSVMLALLCFDKLCDGHEIHGSGGTPADAGAEYFPAAHAVHVGTGAHNVKTPHDVSSDL